MTNNSNKEKEIREYINIIQESLNEIKKMQGAQQDLDEKTINPAKNENAMIERDHGISENNKFTKEKLRKILLSNPNPKKTSKKMKTSKSKHGSKNFIKKIIKILGDKHEITKYIDRIEQAEYNSNKNNHIIISADKTHSNLTESVAFIYSPKVFVQITPSISKQIFFNLNIK